MDIVSAGMFVIDEFRYLDKDGNDDRTKENRQQVCRLMSRSTGIDS